MRILNRKAGAVVLSMAMAGSLIPAGASRVSAAANAAKLTVTATAKTLYIGWKESKRTTTLKVKVGPKGASQKVAFASSNKQVAKVSSKGKVTALKAGKATITVTSKSNKKLKKKIRITVKDYDLKFASESINIALEGTADTTEEKLKLYGAKGAVTYSSDNTEVATVDKNGKVTARRMGKAVITAKTAKGSAACTVFVEQPKKAIHDPSVYRDPVSGKYYSFGSHIRAAVSTNLIGWSDAAKAGNNYSTMNTLFAKDYREEFAEPYAFTMPDGAKENAWAPDIIYNTSMEKYCMYISIVNGTTKCCIAMAASDKPDGPYEYQGMIVCSGLEEDGSDIGKTNVAKALGMTEGEAKASKYAALGSNSPDCIDATVFYDHEGKLWMVYGSFTTAGGIRLLKLDPATGLRGENYADSGDGTEKSLSTDDPYYGKKIANANGEGPYIQMVANKNSSTGYYYYLWITTGNLQNYGGYNMRMVRAEKPEGPYYDTKGNEASKDLQKYALGLRVMDNYKFSFMDSAFASQGGNSATDDGSAASTGDGKTFIQFHTRKSDSDNFTCRTHQTFMNEDGWLVTAPFEYNGETLEESYEASAVAGDYEFLYHRDTFAKTTTANKDFITSKRLTLHEDGTVSGAYAGTWTLSGHNVTIQINDQTYKGVVLEQYEQTDEREKVMVFTAVGSDNRSIWGSKMHKSDGDSVAYDADKLSVEEKAEKDFILDTEGLFGSKITWTSDNAAIAIEGSVARVNPGKEETAVNLTAVVAKGGSQTTKHFTVSVAKRALEIDRVVQGEKLELPVTFGDAVVAWSSSDDLIIRPNGTVVQQPEKGYQTATLTAAAGGETWEFPVLVLPEKFGKVVYEEDYSTMVSDVAIAAAWTSKDKQNCLYVEADETHDSFIKFAGGNTSASQGAQTEFVLSEEIKGGYTVEFDVALETGTRDATEFALLGSDAAFKGDDTNAGVESGYIFNLSATDNASWSINGSKETFALPITWVHVTAIVDPQKGKAAVIIKDDARVYYSGEVSINGTGVPKGLYLRWGAKQSLVSVDNVKVYADTQN